MTGDALERLRAANPVPVLGRAGPAPAFADEPRLRPRPRRVRLLVAAAAVAALVGSPAIAIGLGVVDFGSSERAPARVVKQFESLREGAPAGMDPAVVAGEARQLEVGGHVLWVAPTAAGGLCYGWDGGSGGCDKLGTVPLSVSWLARPTRVPAPPAAPSAQTANAVDGFAHSRYVVDVEIRLDDGTAVRPRVTWISEPIAAGFFRYVAPGGREIFAVVGFRDGEEVIAETMGPRVDPHPYARLDERSKLAEVATAEGSVRLWTAPTKTDGRCIWLEFGDHERAVAPCLPRGYEREAGLALAVHDFAGTSVLAGRCGYGGVRLTRSDGPSRTIDCRDGVVFGAIEPAEFEGTLEAVTKTGKPLPGSRVELARLRR